VSSQRLLLYGRRISIGVHVVDVLEGLGIPLQLLLPRLASINGGGAPHDELTPIVREHPSEHLSMVEVEAVLALVDDVVNNAPRPREDTVRSDADQDRILRINVFAADIAEHRAFDCATGSLASLSAKMRGGDAGAAVDSRLDDRRVTDARGVWQTEKSPHQSRLGGAARRDEGGR
jgi:hypothetical protein